MLSKHRLRGDGMSSAVNESIGLACVPSAIPAPERAQHFVLARELLGEQCAQRADLPDGYAFRFTADQFVALARFIDNERKCCPFMSFDLHIAPEAGCIWLRMTGPAGTRAVLQAELCLQDSCGCEA